MENFHAYQSLHHVHSSFSHSTHFPKNINRVDNAFLKLIKNRIYSKKDSSSPNTSTKNQRTEITFSVTTVRPTILVLRKNIFRPGWRHCCIVCISY